MPGESFHQVEFRDVPGSRVGEGNCFGFDQCKLVKAEAESAVLVVSEVRGAVKVSGGKGGHFFL